MGKFNYLLGEAKEVKIGKDAYSIKPLTARHLGLFMSTEKDNQSEAMFGLIAASLQQTDETITIEDIKELPISIFNDVAEIVMTVNELDKK